MSAQASTSVRLSHLDEMSLEFPMLRQSLRGVGGGVFATLAGTGVLTGVLSLAGRDVGLLNQGLLFLVLTLAISATWGLSAGVFAAILTNLSLNYFFIEPLHQFSVHDFWNVIGLIVFLAVSVIGSSLLAAARKSAAQAQRRQVLSEVTLNLSRAMVGQTDPQAALAALCREAVEALSALGAAVLSRGEGQWSLLASAGAATAARLPTSEERVLAERAVAEGTFQGLGVTGGHTRWQRRIVPPRYAPPGRAPEKSVAILPLIVGERSLGVLRLDGPVGQSQFRDRPEELLVAFTREAALAVQRVELAQAAARSEALRQADAMKTALISSISHDLKTPLATIKASVSSLLDNAVNWSAEDRAAFLESIDTQADRLDRVISDVLDLNRIESGAVRPLLRAESVLDLLEDVVERTAMTTGEREVSIAAAEDLIVTTDRSLVVQALVNLVENAAKYSRAGGVVRLSAITSGPDCLLAVEDEGPGIAADDLPYVFERFYRGSRKTEGVKGSGLGLAIVKAFVSLAGGSVSVESKEAGACFLIRLPIAVEAPALA